MTYLAADLIFLLIQRALLGLGDVAAVLRCHGAFLLADRAVLGMSCRASFLVNLSVATPSLMR